MAARLQMKLGVVPAPDRLLDSPDTVVVVEPSVGAVGRSKGSLYLLVTSAIPGNRARDATRLVAETIRDEYYYDESAGVRICLAKAIGLANKKLGHVRDRYGLGQDPIRGPVGIGIAVVRVNELYVVTVGPAEAYLIRGARLSTLPDPDRARGLPTQDLEPEVWRGEMAVGDSLVLVSPNVVSKLGVDELKDALVTLHPQSAMEHLHDRFSAADGHGSDAAIAIEATEVAPTHRTKTLVPVRPPEPLAGTPDHSPIPLADEVASGVVAMQAGAVRARSAAGGAFGRLIVRLQDLLPHRGTAGGQLTAYSARRDRQRRAAVALLAFVAVAFTLGTFVWVAAGSKPRQQVSSFVTGQRALDQAKAEVDQVFGVGIDLVADDPRKAHDLLVDAWAKLQAAEASGIPTASTSRLRGQVTAGIDQLAKMVDVIGRIRFTFPTKPAVDLQTLVLGPDGAAFVLDHATKAVYRIDLAADPKTVKAQVIFKSGTKTRAGTPAEPRFLSTGGPDLLMLDAKNVLWRWRPADKKGRGTVAKIPVKDSAGWGSDVRAIGTYLRNPSLGLYNLYVVDPSAQQILSYPPAADGGGYPAGPSPWLSAQRDVSGFDSLYIDGDLYVVDHGQVVRYVAGKSGDWTPKAPDDTLLRPTPDYSEIGSSAPRKQGTIYAYDRPNQRLVALDKSSGDVIRQYRIAPDSSLPGFGDMRSFVVVPGADELPDTIVWVDANRILSATLNPVGAAGGPGASGSPGPAASGSPSRSPSASGRPSGSPGASAP
ncbi:MAG TPA: hypothetical protein VFI28_10065 [Candidatus Limnocylindrales bacterium]|nr:hypothetical protein [Candidatus Limnocylindrales bacterium]